MGKEGKGRGTGGGREGGGLGDEEVFGSGEGAGASGGGVGGTPRWGWPRG